MPDYTPPIKDMRFAIHELAGLAEILQLPAFADVDAETIDQVLEEAGKFAKDVLAPLNESGDLAKCHVENRAVVVADGFADAYRQFVDNGWQSVSAATEFGGMGLPETASTAAVEMWHSANLAFALCPLLTAGAIVALEAHGSAELRSRFLSRLVSGEWAGTMNLTEPQAGSDLAAITTKAIPDGDHYRISGTKIFITWGDNPMSENILHLVLARLPDAPPGVRGISMFAVPKYLVNEDGSAGELNDVYPASVEHKLGIHACPTCVMSFGENNGSLGYLIGEPNRGLACMFTMMNHARINVGIQGISLSDRAYQLAKTFALERVQGSAPGIKGRVTIIHHPDVRRMLLVMRAQTEAMRAAAFVASALFDIMRHGASDEDRRRADSRMALLTPIIKGWLSEVAQEVTSLGIQVHGGAGYVEETGAAQYMRDARILPIYEGTTGIQANDLVGRKILGDEGKAMKEMIADMRSTVSELVANEDLQTIRHALAESVDLLEETADWLVASATADPNLPGAASVNLLMGAGTIFGGWQMARAALAVTNGTGVARSDPGFAEAKLVTARFYAEQILPRAIGYLRAAMSGPGSTMAMSEALF
jgi:acyl-CoA dehydrogenase